VASIPQQPKPFVPPHIAKATDLAAMIGRTQCGKKGKRAKWLRVEQHIVRQEAKATYQHLVDFVCDGTIDCSCVGCEYDPPADPKKGKYPAVACHGLHWSGSTIEAVLVQWWSEASSFDTFHAKVASSFPNTYPVAGIVAAVIDELLAADAADSAGDAA
jgi:hypothetical protein